MISSIHIQGYRGFQRYDMAGLGRLNLLVGTNNSGKTSVLEALYLLTSRGDPMALWQLLLRRGERLITERNRQPESEMDVCHLFSGHEIHQNSIFKLSAHNESPERSVTFTITELTGKEREELLTESGPRLSRLALQIKTGVHGEPTILLPLTRSGGIASDSLVSPRRISRRHRADEPQSQFITTDSLDSDDLITLWNKVALTPNEELVLRALRFLDPDIERIASQAAPQYYRGRGGFIIKRKEHDQPIPIGSMGDGMWRMLAMAIAITQCKGGVLLVDEIDTGLHYTVMADMWRLIFGAAKEFDVQVFATTHSFDCIQSLAQVCMNDTHLGEADFVTLQRIEMGRPRSIPYSEEEIKIAAERNIEVR